MEDIIHYLNPRPSKQFLIAGVAFVVGVAAGTFIFKERIAVAPFLLLLGVSAGVLCAVWHLVAARMFFLIVAAMLLGMMRASISMPHLPTAADLAYYNGSRATFVGYVCDEPSWQDARARYRVCVKLLDGRKVKGVLTLSAPLYPHFQYGDVIHIECYLEAPRNRHRALRDKVHSSCFGQRIALKEASREGEWLYGALFDFKGRVRSRMGEALREPALSLLAGFLYGERASLPKDVYEQLITTGTVHLIAVSGYNITLVVSFFTLLLQRARLPRRFLLYAVSVAVVLFVVFVGASASVVRAALFGIIALMGKFNGRVAPASTLLVVAAMLMSAHNPWIVLYDAGFQLSFLATAGLLYVSPIILEQLERIHFATMKKILAETLGATVMTSPFIAFLFERVSLVSIPANLMILFAVPWIMMIGFAFVALSFIAPSLAMPLGWFIEGALALFLKVIAWWSSISFASVGVSLSWWLMLGIYCVIVYVISIKNARHHTQ